MIQAQRAKPNGAKCEGTLMSPLAIVFHYVLGVNVRLDELSAVLLIERNDLWSLAKGCQVLVGKKQVAPHFSSEEGLCCPGLTA